MTNRLRTDYIDDQGAAPNTVAQSLDSIRTSLTNLENSDILPPEKFGAVANDPTAAVTNFAAIEQWLNSGHLGLQVADPNNVYYVACYNLGGANAFRPMWVQGRMWVPFLRIRYVKVNSGFSYYGLNISTVRDFGNALDVYKVLTPAGATRGQTTFEVQDTVANTFFVGQRVSIAAGHDAYDFDGSAGWYRHGLLVTAYTYNALTRRGQVTVDIPCPGNFPERTDSRADELRLFPLTDAQDTEGGWIGYLEIDMSDFDPSTGLPYPLSFKGVGVTVDNLVMKQPPRQATQGCYFGTGSEHIVIHNALFEQNTQAVDTDGDGGFSQFHNIASRIDYLNITVCGPDYNNFREGYAGLCRFGEVEINYTGRALATGGYQYYKSARRFSYAISESRPLVVGTLRYVSQFDMKLDTTEPRGFNDDGFWGSGITSGARHPVVERVESNKDLLYLALTPLYLSMKSVEGPLMLETKHYEFGASAADSVQDFEVGRICYREVTLKYGPDRVGWDFFLYTPPFNDDRGTTDNGTYTVFYGAVGGYTEENETPAATWVNWQSVESQNPIGQRSINKTTGGSFDRFHRYKASAGEAAGDYVLLQYNFYPMKKLFQEVRG